MPEAAIKEFQDLTAEVTRQTDGLTAKIVELDQARGLKHDKLDEAVAKLGTQLEAVRTEFEQRAAAIEAKANRPPMPAGGDEPPQTLDQIFVESREFKSMMADRRRNCPPVQIGSLAKHLAMQRAGYPKALRTLTSAAASAGDALIPQYVQEIFGQGLGPTSILDIIPSVETTAQSVIFVRRTGNHHVSTQFSAQELAAQTVLSVDSAQGFYAGQIITIGVGLGTQETRTIAVGGVDLTANTLTVTAGITNQHEIDEIIGGARFVGVAETALKPMAEYIYDAVTRNVITMAHFVPSSTQILDDAPRLKDFVREDLLDGLKHSLARQFLYGANNTQQLAGILTDADILTRNWSGGVAGDTKADALRRGMTDVATAGESPDIIFAHPSDLTDIELAKGSDGHYLNLLINGKMWRTRVEEEVNLASGTALVGARRSSKYHDRQEATLAVSDSHEDYFRRNMLAWRAENRGALATGRPWGWCRVAFDSAP